MRAVDQQYPRPPCAGSRCQPDDQLRFAAALRRPPCPRCPHRRTDRGKQPSCSPRLRRRLGARRSRRLIRHTFRCGMGACGRLPPGQVPPDQRPRPVPDRAARLRRIDTRVQTIQVARQQVITKDNVPVSIDAALLFRVENASDAVIKVQDFRFAILQYARTSLR